MADVGSMAAAEAAAELGIPTVLTLAPDPHALVQARDEAGTLTRAGFGEADLAEHLVFRDRLLRRLASDAAHLVLFPRPTLRADLHTLLGIDLDDPSVRDTVVAEGIDLSGIDRARREVAAADVAAADVAEEPQRAPLPPALADLDSLLGSLPPERRHLPVALSVGRLHRVKGMATLVETWARHGELSDRCNLLVVGGDLEAPNDEEGGELTRIRAEVPHEDAARRGLILAGHRPNSVVRLWMAAVRRGRPGLAAPDGVYVAASLKEEFGIAIVEALTSGLVVVAPEAGGPATYVEQGVTGVLVDTSSPEALAEAVTSALDLAADPEAAGADSARAALRERFGIDATAAALDEVYRGVASAHRRAGGRGQGRALEPAPASSGARS
jgi:glycosyltransferase involved in cell wall biosynthesis